MALLYRIHYPNDIYATVALSSITKGIVSDPKDPLALGYGDWVSSSLTISSAIFVMQFRPIWYTVTTPPKRRT